MTFLKHQKVAYWIPQVPAQEAALSGLDALAADLSKWQPAILAHQDDMELRGLTEDRIMQHMKLIRGIRMSLADAAQKRCTSTHYRSRPWLCPFSLVVLIAV